MNQPFKIVRGFLLFLSLLGLETGFASSDFKPGALRSNNRAAEALEQGQLGKAFSDLNQAIAEDPFNPALHYNLGLLQSFKEDQEAALKSYQSALELNPANDLAFRLHFNRGEILAKKKDVDGALREYQAALRLRPESIETKANIEFLFQGGAGGQGESQEKQEGNEGENQDQNQDEKDGKENQQPKQYAPNKPQPKKFESQDLTQSDVNKILGELRQQEQKIRSEYNRREVKEKPREKSW